MKISEERCVALAKYVIDTKSTVRQTAKYFGISKSTVHKDLTGRLFYVNRGLFIAASKVLEINKSERHIRGGEATRRKYLEKGKKCKGSALL